MNFFFPSSRACGTVEALESRIRAFIARFSSGGANDLEWDAIAQAIASPDLAINPIPMIGAYNRLFMLWPTEGSGTVPIRQAVHDKDAVS